MSLIDEGLEFEYGFESRRHLERMSPSIWRKGGEQDLRDETEGTWRMKRMNQTKQTGPLE